METKEIIKRLAEPYAASGCEKNVFSALKEMLEPHGEVYSDNMNNLFAPSEADIIFYLTHILMK